MCQVWALGTTPQTAASSHLLHSHYVYESVRCLAVDWNASPPVAALGATSGNISLFELDTGRKLGVLKRHDAEVSAVLWMVHPDALPASVTAGMEDDGSKGAAAGLLVSGSLDGGLMVWDVRQPRTAVLAGRLQGARKRVCSLAASSHLLYVGDYSSSIKVYDMRKLAGPSHAVPPMARLPAAPSADAFGDVCPVAGMIVDPKAKILLNSGIAWWSDEHWEVGGLIGERMWWTPR
ncbi:WD40-repeat-containing domain protein [Dunaliella salina]|uniref:WD40-repeat-containing domain protein n=1 Tax=Dunaliella salina TaxID=3046 RepID=A0ABQ7GM41_DUNSA|nr:WD40-repeat-containing domain protein [Dunaliella salina]|eukprot:KAF5835679.1 WD40-repeat-containing domain protein [Dunaliella salina]